MKGYLLLRGGKIITMNPENEWIEAGDILVHDGVIEQIGPVDSLSLPEDGRYQVKDCRDLLLMPGLVNAHSHSQSALTKMAGSGDRTNTITALWYGYPHNEGRTNEEVSLAAMVNAVQMLKSGCTCTIDQFHFGGCASEEQIGAAVQGYVKSGMRACVTVDMADRTQKNILPDTDGEIPPLAVEMLQKRSSVSAQELAARYRRAAAAHQRSNGGRVLVVPGCPVPNICTDELLTLIPVLAQEQDVHYTCHMLEHLKERQTTEKIWSEPELLHLKHLGFLSDRLNIAHCIWVKDDELPLLKQSGASVTHCPELNIKLGGGVAKIRKMLNAGINVGLGSDSATNQVIFDVMKLTALVHRVGKLNPTDWIYADEILRMATMGGAKALGLDHLVGSLEPGKRADICMLDRFSPWLCPETDLACRLVYTETGGSVDTVMVDGEILVEHGTLLSMDERAVMKASQRAYLRLREANADLYQMADRMSELLEPEIKNIVNTVGVDGI